MFKRLFCKHEDRAHGFSYVQCEKCERVKYAPAKAAKYIEDRCARMVEIGAWDKDGVNNRLMSHGLNPVNTD